MFDGLRSRWTMPAAMRDLDGRQRAIGDVCVERPGQGAVPRDLVRQCVAAQVLHHQHRRAVLHEVPVDDVDDVRVAEARDGVRLAPEARQRLLVARQLGGQHLGGETAREVLVGDLVDRSHAALLDQSDDVIAAKDGGPNPLLRRQLGHRGR
jgi:hypothetical protein